MKYASTLAEMLMDRDDRDFEDNDVNPYDSIMAMIKDIIQTCSFDLPVLGSFNYVPKWNVCFSNTDFLEIVLYVNNIYNAKDYYAKAYADRNNQGSTSYRDASISADIDAFNDLSGTTIEDNFGSLKASFGTASAANSSASDELNSRRQILNNDKTSMQSSINKNNSNRSK